jgi:hypothetical protein
MGKKFMLTEKQLNELYEYLEENPIDRNRYGIIHEAFGQVNNVDEIVEDVYDYLLRCAKTVLKNKNLKRSQIVSLRTRNNVGYNIRMFWDNFTKPLSTKYIFKLYFSVCVYDCGDDEMLVKSVENTKNVEKYKMGKETFEHDGWQPKLVSYIYSYKGQVFINKNKLKHEIVHYYQQMLNPEWATEKKARQFHQHYDKIVDISNKSTNLKVKEMTSLLYFLMPGEISANMGYLRGHLENMGANRKNYKEKYKETWIYGEYQNMKALYNEITSFDDYDWEGIRKAMQYSGAFHKQSSMAKAPDAKRFKNRCLQYINKQIEYLDKKIQQTFEYVIGAYQGKRDDETYTTKNQRLSGQPIQ